jgi:hypothetical protein
VINWVIILLQGRVLAVNPLSEMIISQLLRKLIVSPLTLPGR